MVLLFFLINFNFLENVLLWNVYIIVIFIIGFCGEYVLEFVDFKNKIDNVLFVVVLLYKFLEILNFDYE